MVVALDFVVVVVYDDSGLVVVVVLLDLGFVEVVVCFVVVVVLRIVTVMPPPDLVVELVPKMGAIHVVLEVDVAVDTVPPVPCCPSSSVDVVVDDDSVEDPSFVGMVVPSSV